MDKTKRGSETDEREPTCMETLVGKIWFIVKCEICRRGGYTQKLSNPTDRPFDIPTRSNLYLCRPQSRHDHLYMIYP
jgi:hypothetical protein